MEESGDLKKIVMGRIPIFQKR